MINCTDCGNELPEKRLKAVPSARQCVPCLEAAGDVPKLKRYDEAGQDCEVVSTFYVNSPYIENQQRRVSNFSMPDLERLAEKDAWFTDAVDHVKGYKLSEAFEDDEEEENGH